MANFTGARIRTNNVFGTTTDNPLTNVATTLNSAGLANLDAVSSNHAIIILDPLRTAGAPEIVTVTAHTGAATSATVARAAYGTTARQHASGTLWVHAPTMDDAIRIVTSGTRPSDVYRGQMIFETDTNSFVARDTSDAWQTVVPLGTWTTFTPTLTQGVTLTKTVTYARYMRIGRQITAVVNLLITSAGTAGQSVIVGLPVAAVASTAVVGSFRYLDTGTLLYSGTAFGTSTTTVELISTATAASLGQAPAVTAANTDTVQYSITYEAAA